MIIPEGISENTYRDIVTAAGVAFSEIGKVPSVELIAKYTRHKPNTISRVISTPEFRYLMRERGYKWYREGEFLSPEQIFAVGIITDPSNRKPMREKLRAAGITYSQYRAWLKQPLFSQYIHEIGERMLTEHVADVHTRVVERASSGDIQAMRLYYELTGRMDSQQNKALADLTNTVRVLLEIITRRVTDPAQLAAITQDMNNVIQGELLNTRTAISDFTFENITSDKPIEGYVIESETVASDEEIGAEWDSSAPTTNVRI